MPGLDGRLETAVVVLVEDEELAQAHRELHPEAARRRLPLHVTLLYPWVPVEGLRPHHLARLRLVVRRWRPFSFRLARLGEFPGVAYAAAEPDGTLLRCIGELTAEFPETPPYGGEFERPVPHATLARLAPGRDAGEVAARVLPLLPVEVRVERAALLEEARPDRWRLREAIPLVGHD